MMKALLLNGKNEWKNMKIEETEKPAPKKERL